MSTDIPKPHPTPAPRPGPPPAPVSGDRDAPAAGPAAATPVTASISKAASFGRVADDGTVFVRTPDGEREVGSYPDATHDAALAYFARKYDELAASAVLLLQRVVQTDLTAGAGGELLKQLRASVSDARVVGDLPALDATLEQIATALKAKGQVEGEAREVARKEAMAAREVLVAEAEKIAAVPAKSVQWKTSTARMRELLEDWKNAQRHGARLDKATENALWTRFSTARNSFDKARRTHFAHLDEEHSTAKARKRELVAEAEKLSSSTEWGPTAGAFKRLMSEWKSAGRASRADDDKLWERFKAAQDAFFHAKDEVVASENVEFEANLKVKQGLLQEAEAILPVKDLAAAKAALRAIQDRWDAAGKVPRKDMERVEKAMRRVETTVRDAENTRWKKSDPEIAARANSMVDQLERAVATLQADLDKATAAGNERKITEAREALAARQVWLDQARGGAEEFGG